MNWPNALTTARLILGPVVLGLILTGRMRVAFAVFVFAMLTDLGDGYLARRAKQVTRVGELLDPLADKVLVTLSLLGLVLADGGLVPLWMFAVVVARELIILGCRLGVIRTGSGFATSRMAKWKTASQMTWISLLLLFLALTRPASGVPLLQATAWMTATLRAVGLFAIVLTVASGAAYVLPIGSTAEGRTDAGQRGGPLL
jgi:CDP-diacylglycerol--glycerol-3-phosphate 3-phosphatidyltransferase